MFLFKVVAAGHKMFWFKKMPIEVVDESSVWSDLCWEEVSALPLLFWNILSLPSPETNGINSSVPEWSIKKSPPAGPDKSSWN